MALFIHFGKKNSSKILFKFICLKKSWIFKLSIATSQYILMYKEGSHCAVLHMWLRIFSRSFDAISDVHLTADSFKSCQSLSEAMGINQHNMEYKLTQLLLAHVWKREIILFSFSWGSESLLICMKKVEAFWEEYLWELLSKLNGLLRL